MKVMVIGSGGREHALVWKLSQSEKVSQIYAVPGNAGTGKIATNVNISSDDLAGLLVFAQENDIDLTFVGPEAPLVAGIVDTFQEAGLRIFGPVKGAARLEGSKVYAKGFMKKYGIPTARYEVFSEPGQAIDYIKKTGAPLVVKAEGLAAGKGVTVARTEAEAIKAVEKIMVDARFGRAGDRIVIEECLEGEEATVLAFTDGKTIVPMLPSQDHKPAYDDDQGPNTGGMGAYGPAPVVDSEMREQIYREILIPTLEGLKKEGIVYKGVLYTGLMIEAGKISVLEYNVRFGDPETQVVLPLLKNDLVDVATAIIEGRLDQLEINWENKKSIIVIMASGGYPVSYEKGKVITGIEEAEDLYNLKVFQAGTKFVDGKYLTAGGRVLGVMATGDEFKEIIERAYDGVEKIHFSDAHYRDDIGFKALKGVE